MEKDKDGSTTEQTYIYGPTGFLAINDGSESTYVIKDHLGSSKILLSHTDQMKTGHPDTFLQVRKRIEKPVYIITEHEA